MRLAHLPFRLSGVEAKQHDSSGRRRPVLIDEETRNDGEPVAFKPRRLQTVVLTYSLRRGKAAARLMQNPAATTALRLWVSRWAVMSAMLFFLGAVQKVPICGQVVRRSRQRWASRRPSSGPWPLQPCLPGCAGSRPVFLRLSLASSGPAYCMVTRLHPLYSRRRWQDVDSLKNWAIAGWVSCVWPHSAVA